MTNLTDAQAACRYAREKLGRQVNVRAAPTDAQRGTWEIQQYEAKLLHGSLRDTQKAHSFGSWNMGQVVGYGGKCEAVGIGNCQELTAVACYFLSRRAGVGPFSACMLRPPADHVFVVIGQDPDGNGDYPRDFNAWAADTAICDPWVNIACLASEYPETWAARMASWEDGGTQIQAAEAGMEGAMASGGKWISPEEWSDAVSANDKIGIASSATLQNNGGTNKCCYITTATCESLGLGDECDELQELRRFRDEVLLNRPAGLPYVEQYYKTAPGMVAEIDGRPDRDDIYARVYEEGVAPAVDAIRKGDFDTAERIFVRFVDQGWLRSLGL